MSGEESGFPQPPTEDRVAPGDVVQGPDGRQHLVRRVEKDGDGVLQCWVDGEGGELTSFAMDEVSSLAVDADVLEQVADTLGQVAEAAGGTAGNLAAGAIEAAADAVTNIDIDPS
jgi:hypothetical protein